MSLNAFVSFKTNNAARYLTMLCDHFGTRVKTQRKTKEGWVEFQFGRCDMTADDTRLEMIATANDQSRLNKVMKIVTSHLERFAFRENPRLDWREPPN